MSTTSPPDPSAAHEQHHAARGLFGLSTTFIEAVTDALAHDRRAEIAALFLPLHRTDAARLLELLSWEERARLIEIVHHQFDPEILAELEDPVREEVMELLGPDMVARGLSALDSDDAIEVLEDLDEEDRERLLAALPEIERLAAEAALAYPEDSAGRLINRRFVAVPSIWNVGQTIDFMRNSAMVPDDFYDIFVTDPAHRPVGKLPISRVLRSRRPVPIQDIMIRNFVSFPATADQEDVARRFRDRDLVSAPVLDEAGRMIGVITIDDVVDVIEEETEEDIMRMAGAGESGVYGDVLGTVRSRVSWLMVNLGTAFAASSVIAMFSDTIDQLVALAVLMPIVTAIGGNAGTQALTVAVRALATRQLGAANALRVFGKEVLVALINGVVLALITGGLAGFWFNDPVLGVVIAIAMVLNMLVAGVFGTVIPLILDRVGVDPAVASSVLLTAMTDILGFMAFLGLATVILL